MRIPEKTGGRTDKIILDKSAGYGRITVADAALAHPVERHLAKVEVASSSLVGRSKKPIACAIGFFISAGMVELADTRDLGSRGRPCRFKSCCPHHVGVHSARLGKAGAKALAFSSSVLHGVFYPNRTRCAGLRFGYRFRYIFVRCASVVVDWLSFVLVFVPGSRQDAFARLLSHSFSGV